MRAVVTVAYIIPTAKAKAQKVGPVIRYINSKHAFTFNNLKRGSDPYPSGQDLAKLHNTFRGRKFDSSTERPFIKVAKHQRCA